MRAQKPIHLIFVASFICSLLTCVFCSIIWMAISGVNWLGLLVIWLAFVINACLCGSTATLIHLMFSRLPITMTLYLGNVIPLGIYLFTSYCISPPSVEAWYLLFLIGWIFMSIIPVAVTICIVNKKLDAYRTN